MIPLSLTLTGFLSYRDPVEIDFTAFELACISGHNGAGKSSLLDAITWALFGQARKRDESLINTDPKIKTAEVIFTFEYEKNIYRVQRSVSKSPAPSPKKINKTGDSDAEKLPPKAQKPSILEFYILSTESLNTQYSADDPRPSPHAWKPLTERTLRDTQSRIEHTLRLDYETFVNASFFLQGKADQFTQQRPGDRKRILASILGLDAWDAYRQRASECRKIVEGEIAEIDGRLAEIIAELAEEDTRKAQLASLSKELATVQKSRKAQEKVLESIRKMASALGEQRKLVDALFRQVESASRRESDLEQRAAARERERDSYAGMVARAAAIHAAYDAWQSSRAELEKWDTVAGKFREHEKRRQPFLNELNAARARLLQEQQTLSGQLSAISSQRSAVGEMQMQLEDFQSRITRTETTLAERAAVEAQLSEARTRQAEAKAENPRLKAEMDDLNQRKLQLSQVEGAACPVCGKPLSPDERLKMIEEINLQGKDMGDRYRANQTLLKESDARLTEIEARLKILAAVDQERSALTQSLAALTARLDQTQQQIAAWETEGEPRLAEVTLNLQLETFEPATRARLAELDAELKTIGYDAAAHDDTRRRELAGRASETDLRALEKAQAALEPLERELAELHTTRNAQRAEYEHLKSEYDAAAAALAAAEAAAPDLDAAETELLGLQEQENILRREAGAAEQRVKVLDDQRARRKRYESEREEKARLAGQYKQLERAFGKDGVPALLIEQALPEIETRANDILDRLSGGNMTVRFITQASYKDKKRDDLKETLDIQISDSAGARDYEMYSGGEAFRVNFAVRLALSEVLAQRAGARLQTLVIDEGFGSQDAQGRQRLVEAINLVKADFAKILVITHIDELKDAFPNRIEVEKSERGSAVRVM